MWFNLIYWQVSSNLCPHYPIPKHDIHILMLSLHHHECLECWFRCVLNSSSAHTVCSNKHLHHTCYQHCQWCLLIHPWLSLIYSFIFSSLSWNTYHLLTMVIQMSPNYYTSFNLLHLSHYTVSPSLCRGHFVYAILIMYIFHAIALYTQICFQLTTQDRVLKFLHVSVMNHSHLQGAIVLQVSCSVLYDLSAINDELYTCGVIQ